MDEQYDDERSMNVVNWAVGSIVFIVVLTVICLVLT